MSTGNVNRKVVQFLLQGGLILSIALMIGGVFLNIFQAQTQIQGLGINDLLSESTSVANRLLVWGVFILALTPVFRVLTLVFLWIKEKDWKFVAVALFVLATLTVSVLSSQ